MLKKWLFKLKNYTRHLSVRAGFFALLAVVSALMAVIFDSYVPDRFADLVGGKAVDGILSIMASSMLIVTTFAMSNMVAAYSAATQIATPRATSLIKDDSDTQSAIAIFLGAFIYSIVSIIALSTEYYGEKGRVILLGVTIIVLLAVVWVIIKWVDKLRDMSSISETILRVERVTTKAFRKRAETPTFDCHRFCNFPEGLSSVKASKVGFIQNVDIISLGKISNSYNLELFIGKDIGSFVHLQTDLIHVRGGTLDESLKEELLDAFAIGIDRTFESDPLYGVTVLSSIGIKAMSPSLNDPGTAIDVVASLVRIILGWQDYKKTVKKENPKYDRIYFPELKVKDVLHEGFFYLTKQSLSSLQVLEFLKKALNILEETEDMEVQETAREQIELLDLRARDKYILEADLDRLQ